jgi:GT2 family glycosyltransferase
MLPNLIVPVLNRYDLLRRMFQSIHYPIRDLLIIDNGGEFYDVLNSEFVENVRVLNLPSNLGVAGSWNLGIKLFPHDDRWFFASNDMVYLPGALEKLSGARRDEITLSDMFPHWHTFALGDEAVSRVGLFDESLYPAYFEDNDYMRRAEYCDVNIRRVHIPTEHDNSSTIRSDAGFNARNDQTFSRNAKNYREKMARNDYGAGEWSLELRRLNDWGK